MSGDSRLKDILLGALGIPVKPAVQRSDERVADLRREVEHTARMNDHKTLQAAVRLQQELQDLKTMRQQQALAQAYAQMQQNAQFNQNMVLSAGGGGGGSGIASGNLGGGAGGTYASSFGNAIGGFTHITQPKYDPRWLAIYFAERDRIAYEAMVEET